MALDDQALSGPLPCGTLLDELIAQVTDGLAPLDDAHQAACRYCQGALEAIQEAWEEFQEFARSAVAVPEDLAQRVMQRIRGLARAGEREVLLPGRQGDTRVADAVLAQLARATAIGVDDVIWASVQHAGEDTEDPGGVAVSLRLVVALGPAMRDVAASVRERVIAILEAQVGVEVVRVDVSVEDVVAPEGDF